MQPRPSLVSVLRGHTVQAIVVSGRNKKISFKRTMDSNSNPLETKVDLEWALLSAILNERIDDSMNTVPWKDEPANFSSDDDMVVKSARCKITDVAAKEVTHIYAKRTHVEV